MRWTERKSNESRNKGCTSGYLVVSLEHCVSQLSPSLTTLFFSHSSTLGDPLFLGSDDRDELAALSDGACLSLLPGWLKSRGSTTQAKGKHTVTLMSESRQGGALHLLLATLEMQALVQATLNRVLAFELPRL